MMGRWGEINCYIRQKPPRPIGHPSGGGDGVLEMPDWDVDYCNIRPHPKSLSKGEGLCRYLQENVSF